MHSREEKMQAFGRLLDIMDELRVKCPWDRKQTNESLRPQTIEETYELSDAILKNDHHEICKELGDLMLHVVFYSKIGEENGEFDAADMINHLCEKLIYRHPHVFGSVHVDGTSEVLANWETLKQKEKHQQTAADTLRAVPKAFPALMRSCKIQKRAARVGFDWANAADTLPKVHEEAYEVLEALNSGDKAAVAEEIGDLLFACVNTARKVGVDPELALAAATHKFTDRFIRMEELILSEGGCFADMTLEQMDSYWDRIKKVN